MTARITNRQRRNRLAIRHLLCRTQASNKVESIAENLVAVHSSDPATVYLSLAARLQNPKVEKITSELCNKKSLVRHHAMRRTIWVMTVQVARWAHASATAKIAAKSRQQIVEAFGKSMKNRDCEKWLDQATEKISDLLLSHGPMSAREIGRQLPELVVPIQFGTAKHSATLNAHTKVLQLGGFESTFIRGESTGGWVSGEYVWSVTDNWLGHAIHGLPENESAVSILKLWLKKFGPATLEDIRWYFGWTAKLTKDSLAAIDSEIVKLENQTEAWILSEDIKSNEEPEPWVQLLPGLDATTMGWKIRDWYINSDTVSALFDQFGNAGPTIWSDGRVVGGWIQKEDGSIAIELTEKLGRTHQKLLKDAIDRTVAFCGDVIVRPRFPARIQKKLLGK